MSSESLLIKHWGSILFLIRSVSIVLILLGFFINTGMLSFILGKQGSFSDTTKLLIYLTESVFILSGFILFFLQRLYLSNCSEFVKNLVCNIILLVITISIILIVIEVSTRIFSPQKTLNELKSSNPHVLEQGKNIPWQFKPNVSGIMQTGEFTADYSINSLGMRDKERHLEKKKNTKRILVLGDSFTEGFGVYQNETYVSVLEDLMNVTSHVEVWNAGVLAYGPDMEYVYLKDHIKEINPDIVLLGFYAGNDILDIERSNWESDEQGLPFKIITKDYMVVDGILRLTNDNFGYYLKNLKAYLDVLFLRWSHAYVLLNNKLTGSYVEGLGKMAVFEDPLSESVENDWKKV